jgi:uncharacterized protein (DUF1330 family)
MLVVVFYLSPNYRHQEGNIMKTRYTVALSVLAGAALGAAAIQGLHAQAKPPAYVITETNIIDQAAFNEFSPKVPATMQPFGGKYLIRGGRVVTLQGEAPQRFIVTAFDSMEKAQAWRNSAAWKALMPLREKGTKVRGDYIVEGVSQ